MLANWKVLETGRHRDTAAGRYQDVEPDRLHLFFPVKHINSTEKSLCILWF